MWPSISMPDFASACLEIRDVDVAEIGDVAEVEADGLAGEPVERHLVDRGAVRADVERRVDVRADVLEHRDVVDRVGQRVAGSPRPADFACSCVT